MDQRSEYIRKEGLSRQLKGLAWYVDFVREESESVEESQNALVSSSDTEEMVQHH